jgi:hypothetical protein
MRGIILGLAVVLALLPALAMSCGGGANVENLEGKIEWTENYPSTYLYSQSGPPEQAYKLYVSGQATNVSKDKLKVFSFVIKLYNYAGEKVGEQTFDQSYSPAVSPGGVIHWSFTHYYAERIVRYDVIVTDSQGKEYACALAVSVAEGAMAEDLEEKIEWTESEYNPFTCVYRQDVAPENPYEVNINGGLVNVSQENVNVASLIIRFYNQAGEKLSFYDMLAEETRDEKTFYARGGWPAPVLLTPGEEGWGAIFNQYFAEEVVRYDVFVTDSQGKEYACLRD